MFAFIASVIRAIVAPVNPCSMDEAAQLCSFMFDVATGRHI